MSRNSLHERKPFRNLPNLQTLSHLNCCYGLDGYLDRTTNVFPVNVRIITYQRSSIEKNQLQHRVSHAAWIHFHPINLSRSEKHANLDDGGCRSTSIRAQIPRLGEFLCNVLDPRSARQLRTRQLLELRFPSLHLVDAVYLRRLRNVKHQIYPSTVRLMHLSRRVIIDVISCIKERWLFRLDMNRLFQSACAVCRFAPRVLLIMAKSWYRTTMIAPSQTHSPLLC